MPAKSRWLQQIPGIIERLSKMDAPVVDRAVCASLFGVRRRRAIDLMRRFGGYQAGNTILVDRQALIQQLQRMLDEPEFEQEQQRKRRLSEHLAELEKHRRAAAVRIPVDPDVVRLSPAHLPAGIALHPGRLTVVYSSVEELLPRLYELAQAAANDFDQFSDLTGVPKPVPEKRAIPATPDDTSDEEGSSPGPSPGNDSPLLSLAEDRLQKATAK